MPPTSARNVAAQLTALDVPVPPTLADALGVLDAALAYPLPEAPDISREALTVKAKDVTKLLDANVEAAVRKQAVALARGELVDRLERRVYRALVADTDTILTALAPVFEPAARAFEQAYARLPERWQDAEQLVRSGPEAVETLVQAQTHLEVLNACRLIRQALPLDETPTLIGTAYTVVTDTMVAAEVSAQRTTGSLGWFGNALATEGCTGLHWHPTVEAHQAYAAQLPVAEIRQVRTPNNGFGGVRPEKVVLAKATA